MQPFGYDKNLGHFEPGEPFEDLDLLLNELRAHRLEGACIPAALQYLLRKDPFYQGAATALTKSEKKPTFKSVLIVKEDSEFQMVQDLRGKKYGFINSYCTSSYLGMAIYLAECGESWKSFFSQKVEAGAWQKQIDAVASGIVDATMVMQEVWDQEPKNRETTRIIDVMNGLPCPTVLCKRGSPNKFSLKGDLFSGFGPYQKKRVEEFFIQAEEALRL